jgi:hypothetical protein
MSSIGGTFASENVTAHIVFDVDSNEILKQCGIPGGLRRLSFTGLRGSSTLTVAPNAVNPEGAA